MFPFSLCDWVGVLRSRRVHGLGIVVWWDSGGSARGPGGLSEELGGRRRYQVRSAVRSRHALRVQDVLLEKAKRECMRSVEGLGAFCHLQELPWVYNTSIDRRY